VNKCPGLLFRIPYSVIFFCIKLHFIRRSCVQFYSILHTIKLTFFSLLLSVRPSFFSLFCSILYRISLLSIFILYSVNTRPTSAMEKFLHNISTSHISTPSPIQVAAVDFEYAKILRSTIKLLGTASLNKDGSLAVFVSPMMVPLGTPLSSAKGPGNM
jgi:hypothetical protein